MAASSRRTAFGRSATSSPCGSAEATKTSAPEPRAANDPERRSSMGFALSDMQLASPEFESGGEIPTRYSAYGDSVSPPLEWAAAPEGSRSFAVFVHDPDAPLAA